MSEFEAQFIDPNPRALRHADDYLATVNAPNPPELPSRTRAKWIEEPSEHEDRPGQLLATRAHKVVRVWAELRHGKPALLRVVDRSDPINALRFQVTNRRASEYELIAWSEWFALMDGANLVFLYQEHTSDGETSDLYRLVPASSINAASQ
jgi:hypothetical protein